MKRMKKLFVFLVVLGFFMAGNVWANTVTLQFNPMDVFNYATSDNTMLNQQGTARKIEAANVFRTYNDVGHATAYDLTAVANILGWTGAGAGFQGVSFIQLWLVGGAAYWGEKVVMKPGTTLSASANGEYDWTTYINPYGVGLSIASYNTELTGDPDHQNALSTFNPAQNLWSVTGDFFIDNNGNGIYDDGDEDLVIGQQYTIWFAAAINNWAYFDGVSDQSWGSPPLQGTIIALAVPGPSTINVLATPNPVAINTEVVLTATVDDTTTGGSAIDSAEYSIDGSGYIATATDGSFDEVSEDVEATIAATTFLVPGVHDVCVQGTDVAGNTGLAECILLVVYDPLGGFVTGGGWITSPVGAYTVDPALTGKATFGFVSKYQKGANVPTGNTEFQFRVANFNFKSTEYDWLVVAGAKAQYKGSGTINGMGDYGFMLTAIDGQLLGGGATDKFRIKIWDKINGKVYDNQLDVSDTEDPTTVLGGGSIVIHKK